MKRISLLFLTLFALGQLPLAAQLKIKPVSGVYVGGHIRRERPKTITKLRESGFTYALLFNVHVCADGTLITDGDTICYNGEYVFDQTHPNYQEDIKNLKTAPQHSAHRDCYRWMGQRLVRPHTRPYKQERDGQHHDALQEL